jgi:putative phosphoribosyl transferase
MRFSETFENRAHAGRHLARYLSEYENRPDVLVLALPRGGVPVGFEVARALDAPFDVFLVRKLGIPGHEELAAGAIASGGVRVLNEEIVSAYGIPEDVIARVAAQEQEELERRERAYRDSRPEPEIAGKTVILVDDGLATGSSMRAAARAVGAHEPAAVIIAVPVAPAETCDALRVEADQVVCALTPWPFHAVGLWYHDFTQTTDDEVRHLLQRAEHEIPAQRRRTGRRAA